MADMTAPAPGQFDAQAPGVTAASGTASERLEGDLQSLEQQLAELQVRPNAPAYRSSRALVETSVASVAFSSVFLLQHGNVLLLFYRYRCSESVPKQIQSLHTASLSTGHWSALSSRSLGDLAWYGFSCLTLCIRELLVHSDS